jgi:hypothetical protein
MFACLLMHDALTSRFWGFMGPGQQRTSIPWLPDSPLLKMICQTAVHNILLGVYLKNRSAGQVAVLAVCAALALSNTAGLGCCSCWLPAADFYLLQRDDVMWHICA